MEYVVLNCGIAVFILLAMQTTGTYKPMWASPKDKPEDYELWGFYNPKEGFIGLGRNLQTAMQRKLGGIALPIP